MTRRDFLRGMASAFGTVALPAVAVASECHAGLSTHELGLRKVLVDMAVEDAITAYDRKFVAALDALLRQPGHDGTHVQGGKDMCAGLDEERAYRSVCVHCGATSDGEFARCRRTADRDNENWNKYYGCCPDCIEAVKADGYYFEE